MKERCYKWRWVVPSPIQACNSVVELSGISRQFKQVLLHGRETITPCHPETIHVLGYQFDGDLMTSSQVGVDHGVGVDWF